MYNEVLNREKKLAVIGLGYVGLPIALEFAKDFDVIGFDIKHNSKKNKDTLLIQLKIINKKNNNNDNIIIFEKESHLETVIPKFGSKVKILKHGKYRGKIGILNNIEESKFRGIIQITDSNEQTKEIKMKYENFSKLNSRLYE